MPDQSVAVPPLFLERMSRYLGEEYAAFVAAMDEAPRSGLRVNTLKVAVDDFVRISPFALGERVAWCQSAFVMPLRQGEGQLGKHPYHLAGLYYLQDPSAMAPAELLGPQPGERILDLSAAPGGKTTHLASLMRGQGLLVANEIKDKRVGHLAQNVERWGAGNVVITNETPERLADHFGAFFDRVLVDAPCSGEGMFRKDMGARADWSPEMVAGCAVRQVNILRVAGKLVRPGGFLLYSTCTFAPEEDEGVIAQFLTEFSDFEVVTLPQLPGFMPGRPDWLADSSADLEADSSTDFEADKRTGADSSTDFEADKRTEADSSTDAEADKRTEADSSTDAEADKRTEADSSTDFETDKRTKTDSSTDAEADKRTGADSSTDAEADKRTKTDFSADLEADSSTDFEADKRTEADSSTDAEADKRTGADSSTDLEADKRTKTDKRVGSDARLGALRGAVRLFPHRLAGEGHFVCLLRRATYGGSAEKRMPQNDRRADKRAANLRRVERGELEVWRAFASSVLAVNLTEDRLRVAGDRLYLVPEGMPDAARLRVVHAGTWLGILKKDRFEPAHPLALRLRAGDVRSVVNLALGDPRLAAYLRGEVIATDAQGWTLVTVDGFGLGWGKGVQGALKNHYPRGWLQG